MSHKAYTASELKSRDPAPQAAQLLQLRALLGGKIVDDGEVPRLVHLANSFSGLYFHALRGELLPPTLYKSVSLNLACSRPETRH